MKVIKSKRFNKNLDKIITVTGFASFNKLDPKLLAKSKAPAIAYLLARKAFDREDYKNSLIWLNKVPETHKYYPETLYLKGSVLSLLHKSKETVQTYEQCFDFSSKFKSKGRSKKIKRFYNVIGEKCALNLGRYYYETKQFKKALISYNKVSKKSYIYPYVLIEKAWTHYNLSDFNRTLGILTTYKSPLLESYFFPEAEVLSGLSYLSMCLWNDSMLVVKKFHHHYGPQSEVLGGILRKNKRKKLYFFNLMFEEENKEKDKNIYIKKILTQVRKKIYFNFQLKYYRQAQRELKSLKKWKSNKFVDLLIRDVKAETKHVTERLNNYIREKMFYFVNQTNRLSEEMYNIQLELLSRKKDVIYASKAAITDRSRGSYKNVNRTRFQHFWKFKGGFWADELGDYVFGLKSNCQTSKAKEKDNG